MTTLDNILNKITMYRLVLYVLIGILIVAEILSFANILSFKPEALLYSTTIILAVCYVTNKLFSSIWKSETNSESLYISALILALLISPPLAGQYISILSIIIWASIWTIASKFILAIFKKHIFNPVAFGIAITALVLNESATWWVGTIYMLPFVLIGGFLIVRKIKRFDMVLTFLIIAMTTILITSGNTSGLGDTLKKVITDTPLIFFATVMLTEPLTTPPTRFRRILYAITVGFFFAPNIHIGNIFSTPELALLTGNIFSWLMSPKRKYSLTLLSKEKIATDTGEFAFASDHPVSFKAGQYLEWTLGHHKTDSRGNRRYFTIASSPTEDTIKIAIKFDNKRSSSFKKALAELDEGKTIVAGNLAGDFILPKNKKEKLVFIAGGIGITPFRSMIQNMLDTNEKRDAILIYSAKTISELTYTDLFKKAKETIDLKTVSTLTDLHKVPNDWTGYRGYIDAGLIAAEVPDYLERTYFISGPHSLVEACKNVLKNLDIPKHQIKTDYFPGFV